MRPNPVAISATLASVLLVACATPAAPVTRSPPPMSNPLPPQLMGCDADAAKPNAIGKRATADVVERARIDAGASMARVLKPGQMVTMEFREGRLNIDVDDDNVIVNLRCG